MKTGIFLFFSIILFSCLGDRNVEDKIVSHIEANCKQLPCVVRISEVTDFDWDKMFVFSYGADIGEIEKVVGTPVSVKKPVSRKLVFTKDGKVVHYDELPTNIETIVNNEIIFGDGNYSHKIYLVDNAIFEAQKYLQSGKIYYHLKQKDSEKK